MMVIIAMRIIGSICSNSSSVLVIILVVIVGVISGMLLSIWLEQIVLD